MSDIKQWPFMGYAPGGYMCFCAKCGIQFQADKRATQCRDCIILALRAALDAAEADTQRAVEALQAARATNEKLHRRVQYMEGPHRAYEYELQTARDYHLNSTVKFSRLVGQLRGTLGRIEWQTKTSQDHPVCAVVHEIAAAAIRAQGGAP